MLKQILSQSNKIRLIDDGLESGLNSAYSSYNKLQMMDMDSVVSMFHLILQSVCEREEFCLRLSTGHVLKGAVRQDWRNNPEMLGRTLDLTAAYKQLAVNLEQNLIRALVAYNPELRPPAYFIFNALPFGGTGSVYGLNRVAKSLWHIMVSLGNVLATGGSLQRTGRRPVLLLFLSKCLGSSLTFLNLAMVPSLIVANKKDRIERLKFLSGVTERGRITSSEAATLHGQLHFAQGNAMVVLCNLQ